MVRINYKKGYHYIIINQNESLMKTYYTLFAFFIATNIGFTQNQDPIAPKLKVIFSMSGTPAKNFGEVTHNDAINDAYSKTALSINFEAAVLYDGIGVNAKVHWISFDREHYKLFGLLNKQYEENNRPVIDGRSYTLNTNYRFVGYSAGITKEFKILKKQLPSNPLIIEASLNYGWLDKEPNRSGLGKVLEYNYTGEDGFSANHTAFYEGGQFGNLRLSIVSPIYKRTRFYIGADLKVGNFKYLYNSTVLDEQISPIPIYTEYTETINYTTLGVEFGVKYNLGVRDIFNAATAVVF